MGGGTSQLSLIDQLFLKIMVCYQNANQIFGIPLKIVNIDGAAFMVRDATDVKKMLIIKTSMLGVMLLFYMQQ